MYSSLNGKYNDIKFTVVVGLLIAMSLSIPFIISVTTNNGSDNKLNIPPLKPPVEYAAPDGFKLSQRRILQGQQFSLENELKDRFFSGEGPSDVYGLLASVDGRTNEINLRSKEGNRDCLSKDPIKVTIEGWPQETLEMWVQCYDVLDTNFYMMFGQKNDTVYLFEKGPTTTVAAFVKLNHTDNTEGYPCCYQVNGGGDECVCESDVCINNETSTANDGNCRTIPGTWTFINNPSSIDTNSSITDYADVNLYFSVGNNMGPTQTGSRGLVHLEAKPKSNFMQVTAAGIGLGFCGVQFVTNGDKIMVTASADGPGGTCLALNSTCAAANLESSFDIEMCELGPSIVPLGRGVMSDFKGQFTFNQWEASHFPGGILNSVEIGNTLSSSVNFGPSEVPTSLVTGERNFNNNNN